MYDGVPGTDSTRPDVERMDDVDERGDGSGAGQGGDDALEPLFGQDPSVLGNIAPDGGAPIAGPQDRSDIGPLHGGDQDPATGGSDLGPTTGGGDA